MQKQANMDMTEINLKSSIDTIDRSIQALLNTKDSKERSQGDIDSQIGDLMRRKRKLREQLRKVTNRSVTRMESTYLFDKDLSQHSQHTQAQYAKLLDRMNDNLRKLSTKMRSNRSMVGQDVRVRMHELKSLKEEMNSIMLRLPKANRHKVGDLNVRFQEALEDFQDQYDYLEKQF